MATPSKILRHPSLESSSSITESGALRPSLFDAKDDFIARVSPIGMAAIYFGSFSLKPQDAALSRQALFKLAFAYCHILQPGGLRVSVQKQTAILSGTISSPVLATLGEILAQQIEGIRTVKNETEATTPEHAAKMGIHQDTAGPAEALRFLFATDQTLRSGVAVDVQNGQLVLEGEVSSAPQKMWAESLVEAVGGRADSHLKVSATGTTPRAIVPPDVDDESLQALILLRLRLVRETEHLPVRVKATRGVVSIQGKVRTEALRQRVENLTRATLGLRELRSTITISA